MRYWDSSAVVPLLVEESVSKTVSRWLDRDPVMVTWWGTDIECVSAIGRLERHQKLTPSDATAAVERMNQLSRSWNEVQPANLVRKTARRLLRLHPISAGDSLQLAAALVAAEHQSETLEFVSLDARLCEAAQKEGFPLLTGP